MTARVASGSTGNFVLIGLGANLPSRHGPPRETCEAALEALDGAGVRLLAYSRWYRSAPVPVSSQPWFVNGVAEVETALDAPDLLAVLHQIEGQFGRRRESHWGARVLDLDLLDFRGRLRRAPPPILPHPRLAERAFVLLPLAEVAPGWRHPSSGLSVDALIAALPRGQEIEILTP